jgi:hypothetical protein
LGIQVNLNFHGITPSIYDFLFKNNKLRFKSGESMLDAFIVKENYLFNVNSAEEFSEKLEKSDFFIRLNYFSKSVTIAV